MAITNSVQKRFSKRIRALRQAQGLTTEALANLVGISRTGLSYIEGGRKDARISTLAKIAGGLRVDVKDLFWIKKK